MLKTNLLSFKNVARAVRHILNHVTRKVLCAGNIKFCAVTINVLTKYSVSKSLKFMAGWHLVQILLAKNRRFCSCNRDHF